MPDTGPQLSYLKALAARDGGYFVLHRHDGEHAEDEDEDEDCWCHPLLLTAEQILTLPTTTLQRRLDEHFRIH